MAEVESSLLSEVKENFACKGNNGEKIKCVLLC